MNLAHFLFLGFHQPITPLNQVTMKAKIIFVLFLIRNKALINYIRIFKKYILDPRGQFFDTFSNISWISAIYMLYSNKDEFLYWREIDKKWQEHIKQ